MSSKVLDPNEGGSETDEQERQRLIAAIQGKMALLPDDAFYLFARIVERLSAGDKAGTTAPGAVV